VPSIVRLLVAAAAGIAVMWFLASGAGAQPGTPGYPSTLTPQAGVATPTSVVTPTPTATPPATRAASQVVPANATAIAGDRGRVANIRPNSFSVLWTTDAPVVGQVNYGLSASLGSTASDTRGAAFTGRTHYVEVSGLNPSTVYFFDLISGGQADNNGGQHYQIKTAPEISGSPPSNNAVVGQVLNPGGGAPAGGALVWGAVRDGNGQGTGGTSQLLGALSGGDGRFNLPLQPRTGDLSSYFAYQNEGDAVDLSARGDQGAVDLSINTAVTQGGTQAGEVRLVLSPTPAAGGASPTATATPVPAGATPAPTNTPAQTVRPGAPTPLPVAASATATPLSVAPVQMPPLKEQLLQVGPYPAPAAPPPTPPPTKPAPQPPTVAPQPPPATAKPAPPVPTPTALPAPGAVAPAGAVPGGVLPGGAVAPAPLATAPTGLPPTGVRGPGAGAFGTGQPPAPRDSFAQPVGPAGTPVPSGGPLSTLASLPPLISGLFYGGIIVIAFGAGLAIWSILNGTGWRPR
jgi:hypothetical protein